MDNFYLFLYVLILLTTALLPVYILGRVWFALSPFVINYYTSEKRKWFNEWNKDRSIIVIVIAAVSICLSVFLGKGILKDIVQMNVDYAEAFGYMILQMFCLIFMELKMEHPFKPYLAYKLFNKKKYDERFIFKENNNIEHKIDFHTNEIRKEISSTKNIISDKIQQHQNLSKETHYLVEENNQLLKISDFPFELKNTAHLILADVMQDYGIAQESEESLSDFLFRKRKNKKINFTNKARNGVSVRPILDFFSQYTDLIDKCRAGEMSQADVVKMINEIVVANDKHNNPDSNPINSKNLSKYLS